MPRAGSVAAAGLTESTAPVATAAAAHPACSTSCAVVPAVWCARSRRSLTPAARTRRFASGHSPGRLSPGPALPAGPHPGEYPHLRPLSRTREKGGRRL